MARAINEARLECMNSKYVPRLFTNANAEESYIHGARTFYRLIADAEQELKNTLSEIEQKEAGL